MNFLPQLSGFVLLKNRFFSFRAKTDKHHLVDPDSKSVVVRRVADLYPQWGHTTRDTRDRSITHSMQYEFRQNFRTHSWSVFFFLEYIGVPRLVCSCCFPVVGFSSRVTEACPVTTDFILRGNERTTTTTTTGSQLYVLEHITDTRCNRNSTSAMDVDQYTGTTSNTIDFRFALTVVCRKMAHRIDFLDVYQRQFVREKPTKKCDRTVPE